MGRKSQAHLSGMIDIPEELQKSYSTNTVNPKMKHFYLDGIGIFQDDIDDIVICIKMV